MQEEQGSQQPTTAQAQPTNWTFQPENQPVAQPAGATPASGVSWTASEFIAHHKSASWYGALFGGTVVLAGLVLVLSGDIVSAVVVVVVAIVFGIFASRKPRELQYHLDGNGLHIADKPYPYANFKSYALMKEDGVSSVWLMPLKRFMPILTIYYPPGDEPQIVDVLSQYLPIEHRQPDAVDRLMQKVRF